jgi:DNA invertase Pin-like site-specific DNA recombinase
MEFNSLDAQREAGHAYVASHRAEGWISVRDNYDDGGFSGGNLERPGLKRLLADIEAGLIDVVVVYKIDRLSRSMMDFLKLVEIFDQHGVTFVSITQSFSTTTPMGRLMLNVMLSFAQFEREQTGERIRDKVAASRKKGIWMGGPVPFGYLVELRKLIIHKDEASVVRLVFERFLKVRSATVVAQQLRAEGVTSRKGKPFDKGILYKMLGNRVYIGEAVHKGESYPGEHKPIIDRQLWDDVHAILGESPRVRASKTRTQMPALLKGLIFAPNGQAMTPTHTRCRGKLYRYYVSMSVLKSGPDSCPIGRIPAAEIEAVVIDQLRRLFRAPEVTVQTWLIARKTDPTITEMQVREALFEFDTLWDQLFPVEQARIVALLVERVSITTEGAEVSFRTEGMESIMRELRPMLEAQVAA